MPSQLVLAIATVDARHSLTLISPVQIQLMLLDMALEISVARKAHLTHRAHLARLVGRGHGWNGFCSSRSRDNEQGALELELEGPTGWRGWPLKLAAAATISEGS